MKTEIPPLSPWEMEIMQVLWKTEGEGATILQTQQALARPIGYTTVQTRLNRLYAKGLVLKSAKRPALYSAAVPPATVSAGHLDLLLERVSEGNVMPLIAQLLKNRTFTPEELQSLKELITEQERQLQE